MPENIDYIFTFSGETLRDFYAIDLVKNHSHTKLLINEINRSWYLRYFTGNNIDTNRIIYLGPSHNTWQEVVCLKNFLSTSFARSTKNINIALVSSPYHMKRIKLTINKIVPLKNVHFFYSPVPVSYYSKYSISENTYNSWWTHPYLRKVILNELMKLVYYAVKPNS